MKNKSNNTEGKTSLLKLTKINGEIVLIGVNQIISIESFISNKDGSALTSIKSVGAMVSYQEVKETPEEIYNIYINN
jgi:hypothetical protein